MSNEMERQFVEGAARAAFVMAWVEREEERCQDCDWENGRANYDGRPHTKEHPFRPPRLFAPPTPDYAREWAWKLLGALEERQDASLCSILYGAYLADGMPPNSGAEPSVSVWQRWCDENVRAFGSDVAMMALGTDVSWFDDHASFELHVPDWSARGFELDDELVEDGGE